MSRYRPTAPSRKKYLLVLVGLSVIGFFLPSAWTGKLTNVMQLLVPFQDGAEATMSALAADEAADSSAPVSRAAYEALQRAKEAAVHQAASLALRVAELQRDVDILTATRLWDAGNRIGERGRLIPARVIVADLLSWRSSRLLSAGSVQGVSQGAPVLSRHFTVQPEGDGVTSGMAVLLGEAFVGVIDRVNTHSARVKLLSDVSMQMKVRIGRFRADGFTPLDRDFWLTGRGHDIMEIGDAEWKDIEEGRIEVGDLVLSDPASGMLPAAMTIGHIDAVRQDPRNPLLAILTVSPALDDSELRRVFVFDPNFEATP